MIKVDLYKGKCLTCPNKEKGCYKCKEQGLAECKSVFMFCSDKRVACALCSNYNPEKSLCSLLTKGAWKKADTWRLCSNFKFGGM